MNGPVYASSCPALQSDLSLHSSSYYSDYSGTARRRLSSTGEADTSATSSYEGSDSSENSDETRLDPVSQVERGQLETFFRGLKSQVWRCKKAEHKIFEVQKIEKLENSFPLQPKKLDIQ